MENEGQQPRRISGEDLLFIRIYESNQDEDVTDFIYLLNKYGYDRDILSKTLDVLTDCGALFFAPFNKTKQGGWVKPFVIVDEMSRTAKKMYDETKGNSKDLESAIKEQGIVIDEQFTDEITLGERSLLALRIYESLRNNELTNFDRLKDKYNYGKSRLSITLDRLEDKGIINSQFEKDGTNVVCGFFITQCAINMIQKGYKKVKGKSPDLESALQDENRQTKIAFYNTLYETDDLDIIEHIRLSKNKGTELSKQDINPITSKANDGNPKQNHF